ncbi:acyl-CoA thioesterase [Paenarthrobacter sp. Z7-10]|uniref:acyl-CoA thioesterase n=1 Tax=Paenarthrobacter sp. Z7-10 TaxID=2787635 RepID=UPI0022A92F27|nr:thioesterase family protein [Paenarthrobacter sp. Z7-10]MCZ2404973.1 acyl-CoA thioesterase [Paenarthrobacter sp. Z7-10]
MATVIQIPLQIRFGDIDSYGHVNNVTFLQYLEDARVQLIHTPLGAAAGAGAGAEQTFEELIGPDLFTLVGRHEIEYLAPLLFRRDPVFVNIWVTRLGGSSFEFGYTVAERDGSTIYAQASSGIVLVSRDSGRPVRLTGPQRHALETWLGDDVAFRRRPASSRPKDSGGPAQSVGSRS